MQYTRVPQDIEILQYCSLFFCLTLTRFVPALPSPNSTLTLGINAIVYVRCSYRIGLRLILCHLIPQLLEIEIPLKINPVCQGIPQTIYLFIRCGKIGKVGNHCAGALRQLDSKHENKRDFIALVRSLCSCEHHSPPPNTNTNTP